MDNPLISVIIPAYNASAYIGRTLISVIHQSYQNIEILVVNDGSTDETLSIAKYYAGLDSRIILIHQANQGVAAARNLGISFAKGEFIAPLDADDIWHTDNLKKKLQVLLKQDVSVGMVYSWSADIDEFDHLTGNTHTARYFGHVLPGLCLSNFIGNASSTMIRSECFHNIGDYAPDFKAQNAQGAEDWDLYIRIAMCYQVQVIPEFLVGYRQLTNSMSKNTATMMKAQYLTLQRFKERLTVKCPVLERRISSSYLSVISRQSYEEGAFGQTFSHLTKAISNEGVTILLPFRNWRLFCKIIRKLMVSKFLASALLKRSASPQVSVSIHNPTKVYSEHLAFNLFLHMAEDYCLPIKRLSRQIYPSGQKMGVISWWQTVFAYCDFLRLANTITGKNYFGTQYFNSSVIPIVSNIKCKELSHQSDCS